MKTVTEDDLIGYIKILFSDIDSYPLHFILHLFHAIEIVGYKHPDEETRTFWHQVYLDFGKIIHFNPEIEDVLDKRLSDKN